METAESIIQLLLRLVCDPSLPVAEPRLEVLRYLSGGFVTSMLFAGGPVYGYDVHTNARSSRHKLLCALLKLSTVSIASVREGDPESNALLELVSSLYRHIQTYSLQITGDWPPTSDFSTPPFQQHITLARLHEAEAACAFLWALAGKQIRDRQT